MLQDYKNSVFHLRQEQKSGIKVVELQYDNSSE